jgi:hypothetical protein
MKIRPATLADAAVLTVGFVDFYSGMFATHGMKPDPDRYFFNIGNRMGNDPGYVCFIAEDGGEFIGSGAAAIGTLPFAPTTPVATEQHLYTVLKRTGTLRAGRAMSLLITALEEWAKAMNCKAFIGGIPVNGGPSLARSYARRGYKPLESLVIKELT